MTATLPAFDFVHKSYVTPNLDRGMAAMSALWGVTGYRVSRDRRIGTPNGEARLNMALTYIGDMQLELIEPIGGDDGLYREMLPADPDELRFHHFGTILGAEAEWDQLQAYIAANQVRTPVFGGTPGRSRYLYADLRHTLGHYLEFMYFLDGGRGAAYFAEVPRTPLAR